MVLFLQTIYNMHVIRTEINCMQAQPRQNLYNNCVLCGPVAEKEQVTIEDWRLPHVEEPSLNYLLLDWGESVWRY